MKQLSRQQPPSVTYAVGATSPVGSFGEVVWSTAAASYLQWRGASWMVMPRIAIAADGAPPAIGAAGAVGNTGIASDNGHTHAHGNQLGGALHATADVFNAGFMSAAQFQVVQTLGFGAAATSNGLGDVDKIPKTNMEGVLDDSFIDSHQNWQGPNSVNKLIAGSSPSGKLSSSFIDTVAYEQHVFVPSVVVTQDANNVIFHTRTFCGKQFMALLGAEPVGNVGFGRPGPRLLESSNLTVDKGWYQPAGDTNVTTSATQTGFFNGMAVTGTQTSRSTVSGGANGTSLRRGGLSTTTTTGNTSHFFQASSQNINAVWRSTNITDGGFFFNARFVIPAVSAAMRYFVGLYSGSAVLSNVNPSLQAGLLGFGVDSGDTTLQFFTGVAAGKIAIAGSTPKTAGSVFEVWMYHPSGGGIMFAYRLGSDNATTPTFVNPGAITWLAAGTKVKPYIYLSNGTNATAVGLDICGMYMEAEA